jgi:hypothetical protein
VPISPASRFHHVVATRRTRRIAISIGEIDRLEAEALEIN